MTTDNTGAGERALQPPDNFVLESDLDKSDSSVDLSRFCWDNLMKPDLTVKKESDQLDFGNMVAGIDLFSNLDHLRNCLDSAVRAKEKDPDLYKEADNLAVGLSKYVAGGLKDDDRRDVQKLFDSLKDKEPERVRKLLDVTNGILIQERAVNDMGDVLYLQPGKFNTAGLKDNQQEYELRLVPKASINNLKEKDVEPKHVETKDKERVIFPVPNGGLNEFFKKALPQPPVVPAPRPIFA